MTEIMTKPGLKQDYTRSTPKTKLGLNQRLGLKVRLNMAITIGQNLNYTKTKD